MISISCLESKLLNNKNWYGRFQLAPFQKGEGLTVANALRRTLLAEKSNFFITWVDFYNAEIPYSVLTGMRESIFDILLNLKQVIFTSDKILPNNSEFSGKAFFKIPLNNDFSVQKVKFFSKKKFNLEPKINFLKKQRLNQISEMITKGVRPKNRNLIMGSHANNFYGWKQQVNPDQKINHKILKHLTSSLFSINKQNNMFRSSFNQSSNIILPITPKTGIDQILKFKNFKNQKIKQPCFNSSQYRWVHDLNDLNLKTQNIFCQNQILGKTINSENQTSYLLPLKIFHKNMDLKSQWLDNTYNSKKMHDSTYLGYICAKGPATIYAKNIKLPKGLKCVDPDKYIATLADDGLFYLRFALTTEIQELPLSDKSNLSISIKQSIKFNTVRFKTFPKILFNKEIKLGFYKINCAILKPEKKLNKGLLQYLYKTQKNGFGSYPIALLKEKQPVELYHCDKNKYPFFSFRQNQAVNKRKINFESSIKLYNPKMWLTDCTKNLIKEQRLMLTNDSIKQCNFQNTSITANIQKTCLLNIQIKHYYYKSGRFDRFLFDLIKPFKPNIKSTYYNKRSLKNKKSVFGQDSDWKILIHFKRIFERQRSNSQLLISYNRNNFKQLVLENLLKKKQLSDKLLNTSSIKSNSNFLKTSYKNLNTNQFKQFLFCENKTKTQPYLEIFQDNTANLYKNRQNDFDFSLASSFETKPWPEGFKEIHLSVLNRFKMERLKWQKIFKSIKTNSIYDYLQKLHTSEATLIYFLFNRPSPKKTVSYCGKKWISNIGFQTELRPLKLISLQATALFKRKAWSGGFNRDSFFFSSQPMIWSRSTCDSFKGQTEFDHKWSRKSTNKQAAMKLGYRGEKLTTLKVNEKLKYNDLWIAILHEPYIEKFSKTCLWFQCSKNHILYFLKSYTLQYNNRSNLLNKNPMFKKNLLRDLLFKPRFINTEKLITRLNCLRQWPSLLNEHSLETKLINQPSMISNKYRFFNRVRTLTNLRIKPFISLRQVSYKFIKIAPYLFQNKHRLWLKLHTNHKDLRSFVQAFSFFENKTRMRPFFESFKTRIVHTNKKLSQKRDSVGLNSQKTIFNPMTNNNVVLKPIYLNVEQIIYILKQTTRFRKNQRINPIFFSSPSDFNNDNHYPLNYSLIFPKLSNFFYKRLLLNNTFLSNTLPVNFMHDKFKKNSLLCHVWILGNDFVFGDLPMCKYNDGPTEKSLYTTLKKSYMPWKFIHNFNTTFLKKTKSLSYISLNNLVGQKEMVKQFFCTRFSKYFILKEQYNRPFKDLLLAKDNNEKKPSVVKVSTNSSHLKNKNRQEDFIQKNLDHDLPIFRVNYKSNLNNFYNEPYNINIYHSKISFNLRYTYPFKYTIFETFLPFVNFSEKVWYLAKNSNLAPLFENFQTGSPTCFFLKNTEALSTFFSKDLKKTNTNGCFETNFKTTLRKSPQNINVSKAFQAQKKGVTVNNSIQNFDFINQNLKEKKKKKNQRINDYKKYTEVLNSQIIYCRNFDYIQYNESFKIYTTLAYTCLKTYQSHLSKYHNFNRRNKKKLQVTDFHSFKLLIQDWVAFQKNNKNWILNANYEKFCYEKYRTYPFFIVLDQLPSIFNSTSKWRIMNDSNFNDAFIIVPYTCSLNFQFYESLNSSWRNLFSSFVPSVKKFFYTNSIGQENSSEMMLFLNGFDQSEQITNNKLNWSKTTTTKNELSWLRSYPKKHTKLPFKTTSFALVGNKNYNNDGRYKLKKSSFLIPKFKIKKSLKELAISFENIYYKNFLWNSRKITLRTLNNAVLPLVTNRKYTISDFIAKKDSFGGGTALMNNGKPKNIFPNWKFSISVLPKECCWGFKQKTRQCFVGTSLNMFKKVPTNNLNTNSGTYENFDNMVSQSDTKNKNTNHWLYKPSFFRVPRTISQINHKFSKVYNCQKAPFYYVRHKNLGTTNFMCSKTYANFRNENQIETFKPNLTMSVPQESVSNSKFLNTDSSFLYNNEIEIVSSKVNGQKLEALGNNLQKNEKHLPSLTNLFQTQQSDHSFSKSFWSLRSKWRSFLTGSLKHSQEKDFFFGLPFINNMTQNPKQSKNSQNELIPYHHVLGSKTLKQGTYSSEKLISLRKNRWISKLIEPSKFRQADFNNTSKNDSKIKSPLINNLWSSSFFCKHLLYAISTKSDLFLQNLISLSGLTNQTVEGSLLSQTSSDLSLEENQWGRTQPKNDEINNTWIPFINQTDISQTNLKVYRENLKELFEPMQIQSERSNHDKFLNVKSFPSENIKSHYNCYNKTIQKVLKSQNKLANRFILNHHYHWQKAIHFAILSHLKRSKFSDVTKPIRSDWYKKKQLTDKFLLQYPKKNIDYDDKNSIILLKKQYSVRQLKNYERYFGNPLRRRINQDGSSFCNITSAIKFSKLFTISKFQKANQFVLKSWKSIVWTSEANTYFCFCYPFFIQNCNLPWQKSKYVFGISKHWLNRTTLDLKSSFKSPYFTYLSKIVNINTALNSSLFMTLTQLSASSNTTHQSLLPNKLLKNNVLPIWAQGSYGIIGYFTIKESLNYIYKVNYIVESQAFNEKLISQLAFHSKQNDEISRSLSLSVNPNMVKRFENVERDKVTTDSLTVSNFLNESYSFIPSKTILSNSFNRLIDSKINQSKIENENEYIQIDIWTNGELSPRQALLNAFKKLFELFYNLSKYNCLKPIEI